MKHFTEDYTQFKRWTFTRGDLDALRSRNFEQHAATVSANIVEEQQLSGKPATDPPDMITAAEHMALVTHYSVLLRKFCGGKEIRFPENVRAAAMMYFWRFYLHECAMAYPPKDVLLTSALLASKTENFYMKIEDLLQISNPPDRSVLVSLEFVLCKVLHFDLKVRSPFLPLHGLYLELESFLRAGGGSGGDSPPSAKPPPLGEAYVKAKANADHLLSTDAQLLYTPSQLAWGCFRAACKTTGLADEFEAWFEDRLRDSAGAEEIATLKEAMDAVDSFLARTLELAPAENSRLRDKLLKCLDPAKNPASAVSKKREEEAKQRQEERKKKKREVEMRKHAELGDVFQ